MQLIAPIRGTDAHGSGAYQAPRSGGRKHNGIDIAAYPDSLILAVHSGVVTKLGFPYSQDDARKKHFRYVQVTTNDGVDLRYFYVVPMVLLGQWVNQGDLIGSTQDLTKVYPGITNHVHFEVKRNGEYLSPENWAGVKT